MSISAISNLLALRAQVSSIFDVNDSEDQLWKKLEDAVGEAYDITSVLYSFTHSKYTVSRTGLMPSIYCRHNFPEEYLATFPNGFTLEDSVASGLILSGHSPLLWGDFENMELTPVQRRRIELDDSCGMGVGVSFGFRFGANNGISALCLASRHKDKVEFARMVREKLTEMENLATTFDALMRPAMIRTRIQLTPREKDVLSYSAGGMTAKQIADYLSLSPKTVNNTLERARHAIGAVSTMEAVAKALVYELI